LSTAASTPVRCRACLLGYRWLPLRFTAAAAARHCLLLVLTDPNHTQNLNPPGGRGVIDEIEKQLALSNGMVEPSRAVLYRFGNISSSSIWWAPGGARRHGGGGSRYVHRPACRVGQSARPQAHSSPPCASAPTLSLPPSLPPSLRPCRYVLSYIESMGGGVRKGDRVWQLGFGSGFKCNSAVWRAKRRIRDAHYAWDGFDVEKMRAELNALPH
jgi:hypothetical protein